MAKNTSRQSKGGKARADALSPQERSAIAKKAAEKRWAKQSQDTLDETPYSMFRGTLAIGELEMECHVLSDDRRAFTQREIVRVLTAGRESGNLTRYLEGNPLINSELILGRGFKFRIPGTQYQANGYEATTLIDICDSYIEASDLGQLKSNQQHLARQAEIIIRSSAKVGIIALVDEATGYQTFRAKRDLQLKFQAFIADEMQEWARMFPDEFWYELARLEGIEYSPRSRPLRWGRYVMMFVYDAIDKDIGRELRKKNPNPHFKKNHHQWLKEFGRDKVNNQIQKVIAIMQLCNDMDDFRKKFNRVFRKSPMQLTFEGMSSD